jgi:HlyD family secretion protein
MTAHRIAFAGAALLALAACSKPADPGYQGWVEADLIFVSPDEAGRVETLSVREGDAVEKGAPLFTVDPDLQQADVDMAKASVTNATQAYERAQALLKTQAGTPKTVEETEATLRTAQGAARLRADAPRPPQGGKSGVRLGPADLLPAGRAGAGGAAGGVRCCRRATSRSGSSCRRRRWRRSRSVRP